MIQHLTLFNTSVIDIISEPLTKRFKVVLKRSFPLGTVEYHNAKIIEIKGTSVTIEIDVERPKIVETS